jgi:hypothetical protein
MPQDLAVGFGNWIFWRFSRFSPGFIAQGKADGRMTPSVAAEAINSDRNSL